MSYFVVFQINGFVIYESGIRPLFAEDVIKQISTNNLTGKRRIRDSLMEYEIHGKKVFLSISNKEILQEMIKEYIKNESNNEANNESNTLTKNNTLNFSDQNLNIKNSSDQNLSIKYFEKKNLSAKNFEKKNLSITNSFKKSIFSLFSNGIEIDKIEEFITENLIKKNIDLKYVKLIVENILSEILHENNTKRIKEKDLIQILKKILEKILPQINLEKFVENIKKSDSSYKIIFVGVNGVGKSTSLAKVTRFLLEKNIKTFIAACDTFRAGAVEQLKVHVDRFIESGHHVGFYESGYKKDDANVCKSAIIQANNEKYEVVLIDTAGRMHNKAALMSSLSKLIRVNNPDHIIFVGEALVGGDSLNHIKEFNKSIDEGIPGRKIDSIILTKIDTVSEKIGQVLNLTLSSSAPILFLGTGQGNMDLKEMNSSEIAVILTT